MLTLLHQVYIISQQMLPSNKEHLHSKEVLMINLSSKLKVKYNINKVQYLLQPVDVLLITFNLFQREIFMFKDKQLFKETIILMQTLDLKVEHKLQEESMLLDKLAEEVIDAIVDVSELFENLKNCNFDYLVFKGVLYIL